ncbi:MAG: sarcosine oxidase subunit delta [Acidiferrobacterales bacterium]
MLHINCPYCGPRAQIEFTYGGDANAQRPAYPEAVTLEAWLDYVYLRDNPRGPHWELWQHTAGCRQWLRVHRDTFSHEVLATEPAGGAGSGDKH